jgi:hypothetical protein
MRALPENNFLCASKDVKKEDLIITSLLSGSTRRYTKQKKKEEVQPENGPEIGRH